MRVVKAFAAEEQRHKHYSESVTRVFDQSMISTRLRAFYNPFIGFLPQLGLAALLLVGGRAVVSGRLTLAEFTAFYGYLLMLLAPVRTLGWTLGSASGRPHPAHGSSRSSIASRGSPQQPARARYRPGRDASSCATSRSPTARTPAAMPSPHCARLAHCSGWHDARAGRRHRVGQDDPRPAHPAPLPADRGKRVVAPDVRAVDPRALRAQIAVVDNDPFLFSATVHENIAYARAGASREEVVEAARRARADGFIGALPDGYDTRVGKRGLTLSGGERQRIAIARALLADPRILILDDATSSIDASTSVRSSRASARRWPGAGRP